jgi:protein-S-isoprenylcysteine O-methyltransferase Ste14
MNKNKMNKVLAPVLAVLAVNQILTGVFGMSLPPSAFNVLHRGGGFVLLAAAVLHVLLNWGWVKANYLKAL